MNSVKFFNTVGNYRLKKVYLYLIKSEFADVLLNLEQLASAETICKQLKWDQPYGTRYLDMLVNLGLLEFHNKVYAPTNELIYFFSRTSKFYQGNNIMFESFLEQTWDTLEETLQSGERVFGKKEKTKEQYFIELEQFIRAMDNVATIRANEMLEKFTFSNSGRIIDIAGGSGAFIHEFLNQYPQWKATYFDLPDVTALSKKVLNEKIVAGFLTLGIKNNIEYLPGNFLEMDFPENLTCDCILLSNIIHCYNSEIVEGLYLKCKSILNTNGSIIVHDFYKDSPTGTLYDVHMMLNTFGGRSYFMDEVEKMMKNIGLNLLTKQTLPSGSACMRFG